MRTVVVVSLAAAIGGTPVIAQEPTATEAVAKKAQGEVRVVDTSDRSNPPPVIPVSETVTLSTEPPEGLEIPAGVHGAQSGTVTIRNKKIHVVVGKSSEDGDVNTLIVDLNGDGKLQDSERMELDTESQEMRGQTLVRGQVPSVELSVGGATLPASFSYSSFGGRTRAALQFARYLHADVEIDGEERVVAIVDKDLDGDFGGKKDLWTITTPDGRPTRLYGLSALDERRFEDGKLIGIDVSGTTVNVRAEPAEGPDPKDEASHRARVEHIWAERFDGERAQFVQDREIDLSRPEATQPIDWQYVTFEEGLKRSKETGKPLFVDVMAFWCVWCYRLDYYTYVDKEVADLLNDSFIPVKIIQEQAPEQYEQVRGKLEGRGIPAMGIFNGDGELLHQISGWKKPVDFVAELQKVDTGG